MDTTTSTSESTGLPAPLWIVMVFTGLMLGYVFSKTLIKPVFFPNKGTTTTAPPPPIEWNKTTVLITFREGDSQTFHLTTSPSVYFQLEKGDLSYYPADSINGSYSYPKILCSYVRSFQVITTQHFSKPAK